MEDIQKLLEKIEEAKARKTGGQFIYWIVMYSDSIRGLI